MTMDGEDGPPRGWSHLLGAPAPDDTERTYSTELAEFMAALTVEFGVELDESELDLGTDGVDSDENGSENIPNIYDAMRDYVREWFMELLQESRPGLGIRADQTVLKDSIEIIADELMGMKVLERAQPKDALSRLLIKDDETVEQVAARVRTCLHNTKAQILAQEQGRTTVPPAR